MSHQDYPTNSDDVIDSRDVIARIEELESDRQELLNKLNEADVDENRQTLKQDLVDWDEENGDELTSLKYLAEEGESYSEDWRYGATLIRASYFEDYAREFANDIGAINRNESWPATCIDWAQAAEELQQDYSAVDFDGVTYWVR